MQEIRTWLADLPDAVYEKFMAYHMAHRWIWTKFELKTLLAIQKGRKKYSAKTVMEVVRWDNDMATESLEGEDFQINNDYTAYYARIFMGKYPRFGKFFEIREIRNEGDANVHTA